ncbi:hypothetical protein AB0L40_15550 [Patulibacter sp. NPDC049589]|uniref:hypothetical protein n=1 Tax=Patulibacter sp. NPDC049589 TaxID=3154731 RepID=UPI003414D8F5
MLLVLVVAGAFLAGRATAPDDGSATAKPATTPAAPVGVAAATAEDEAAMGVARDLSAFVASCVAVAVERDPARCRTTAQLNVGSTLPLVDGRRPRAGEAAVTASASGSRVTSVSRSGNVFEIATDGTARPVRTCTDSGVAGAGCVGGTW